MARDWLIDWLANVDALCEHKEVPRRATTSLVWLLSQMEGSRAQQGTVLWEKIPQDFGRECHAGTTPSPHVHDGGSPEKQSMLRRPHGCIGYEQCPKI